MSRLSRLMSPSHKTRPSHRELDAELACRLADALTELLYPDTTDEPQSVRTADFGDPLTDDAQALAAHLKQGLERGTRFWDAATPSFVDLQTRFHSTSRNVIALGKSALTRADVRHARIAAESASEAASMAYPHFEGHALHYEVVRIGRDCAKLVARSGLSSGWSSLSHLFADDPTLSLWNYVEAPTIAHQDGDFMDWAFSQCEEASRHAIRAAGATDRKSQYTTELTWHILARARTCLQMQDSVNAERHLDRYLEHGGAEDVRYHCLASRIVNGGTPEHLHIAASSAGEADSRIDAEATAARVRLWIEARDGAQDEVRELVHGKAFASVRQRTRAIVNWQAAEELLRPRSA